jgi:membrane-bound lytic murein transglycosylase B
MKRLFVIVLFISFALTIPSAFSARRQQSWNSWVQDVRVEAIQRGIRPSVFDNAFNGMTPSARHLRLDRSQPERRLTFLKYRNTRGDAYRIKLGRRAYKRHKKLLDEVGRTFGVSPCFIVSLWGLESSYGHYMGNFAVIRSLATLAYDTRRSAFFRRELFHALRILNEGHISLKDFKGEWAGATGQPQFLPSSWHNYAVDYNNDNVKDIWKNHGDIFASIANYLAQHGWQTNQPWAIQVSLPRHFNKSLLSLKIEKTVKEWEQLGVKPITHRYIDPSTMVSVIRPLGGPNFMVFNNFKVIMKWNRSTYYAGTVGYVADKICRV